MVFCNTDQCADGRLVKEGPICFARRRSNCSNQNSSRKWQKEGRPAVAKALTKGPERKENFTTGGGIPLKRTYTPEDVDSVDYTKDLGFPGVYPFTRGVQPTMYRGRFWTMRQYAGFATAEDSNKRYRYLLNQAANLSPLPEEDVLVSNSETPVGALVG